MCRNQYLLLFVACLSITAISASNYATSEGEERVIIFQYFNYIDIIMRIKLDNMLAMTRRFVTQLLSSVPYEQRRNSAQMLELFISDAQRVRISGSLDEKEEVLQQLQQLIATIQTEMVKQEPEDLIIRQGLMGTFELLARLSIEDRQFNEKFTRASEVLKSKFIPEGWQRHAQLFEVVAAIEREQNIVEREELMKRFKEIKQNY